MEERLNQVKAVFSNPQTVSVPGLEEEFGFVTECISEEDFAKKAEGLEGIISRIRIRA